MLLRQGKPKAPPLADQVGRRSLLRQRRGNGWALSLVRPEP